MAINYLIALFNIVEIEYLSFISFESVGGHDIIPAMTYLIIINSYILQGGLYYFNFHSLIDW